MKRLLLFATLCLAPFLLLSCACQPVKVVHDGATLFEGKLTPSDALRKETLYTRNDLSYSFPCVVEVKL